MGCALFAQRHFSRRAGCVKADSRGRAIRFQLALSYRDRLFLCCDRLWDIAWPESSTIDEDLLENACANAAGGDCDLFYARAGLRDTLFGTGRGVGVGIHAHGMAVSIFRHVPRLVGGGAY